MKLSASAVASWDISRASAQAPSGKRPLLQQGAARWTKLRCELW
jgi:hypothetical protein